MEDARFAESQEAVLDCVMDLVRAGMVAGMGGNVSVRIEGGERLAVTPSQCAYGELVPEDICIVDFDLKPVLANGFKPSMETPLHVSIYRNRPDVGAVIHTHQVFASVFSLINEPIPALFDEVTCQLGRTVEVVPYGRSGTPQLMENLTARLGNRSQAYILQNHGAVCLGPDLESARQNVDLLEKTAQVYYYALTTGKNVTTLPPEVQDQMEKSLRDKLDQEVEKKKW